ncbi:methylmalonyl-CoA mutase family protein [Consotaella salsifontis]|uniref:Methylmalonyl-CoA mutase n=1 Tax=Consotaella salsifontis TaxID=1365950 RepID=A0A1T4QNW3_9HYPH|nr:methylmalonyl-CoA mutase family protein [Consotaella salsifontis]SKA05453.1 methylmalonyl-CoA mutase [Consotaella salsifontis]
MTEHSAAINAEEAQAEWRRLVETALKGRSFESLVSQTADGIAIQPLYDKAEPSRRALPRRTGPWRVVEIVDHPDTAAALAAVLEARNGGAGGISLALRGSISARGFGLPSDHLAAILEQIDLTRLPLRLDLPPGFAREMFAIIHRLLARHPGGGAGIDLDLGLDPIGDFARSGREEALIPSADLGRHVAGLKALGLDSPILRADGRVHHEAGASEAEELAAVLATALSHLRALESAGLELEVARQRLGFLLVADADQFLATAKFRALRLLWAEIEAACGLAPRSVRLDAETAWRMTSRRDPWVNLLRNTMAAAAAAFGGADAVAVLPHTAPLGLADPFARRTARNIQIILRDESQLWRVADPAGGAGGIEALTDELCDKAWTLFQEIEASGGMAAMLKTGAWQVRVAATRARREKAIATRTQPLVGTSVFPLLDETAVAVLAPAPPEPSPEEASELAMRPHRLAEPFERLRDRADRFRQRTGREPTIFLAAIGRPADFTARANFAAALLAAGGIRLVGEAGHDDAEAVVAGFAASGADGACLCASDADYASGTLATDVARALREKGCGLLLAVAPPKVHQEHLGAASLDELLHAGLDAVALLSRLHERIGVGS